MSLDGKTGSNLVNLDGKSDSNTGGQYSNTDTNLIIKNISDTINLSTTINISDLVVKGSVSLQENSLDVSNINNLQTALNSKQNNIKILGGTNVYVTESPIDTWTINSAGAGGGGGQYTNTDTNLGINNVSNILNLSTTINASNISCDVITSKKSKNYINKQ